MSAHTLDSLYRDHLRELEKRAAHALERAACQHLVVFSGAPPLQFLDDQNYPFKVNPHFKAWMPVVDNPDCLLICTPGKRPTLLFHQPIDYWYKPPALPTGFWVEHFDIVPVPTLTDARPHLTPLLAHSAFVGEITPELAAWGFAQINPQPLLDSLHFARAAKTAYEIECLRRASATAVRGHRAAEIAFRAGESELGAHLAYLEACDQREEELPYNNIVAFNANGSVLHYQYLERRKLGPDERLSFLIDAGAQFNGYACDITRTYAARSGDFAALISAVDHAQQALCTAVTPGTDYREVHLLAHRKLAQVLRDADIITVEATTAVESGLSSVFFPHGIGHLLGLQVHDVGGFLRDESGSTIDKPAGHGYLRLTRRLEPGFVVTVEPGLYFIPTLLGPARANGHARAINWKRIEQLLPFGGVRIEDDIVVTSDGHRNLTREAFAA